MTGTTGLAIGIAAGPLLLGMGIALLEDLELERRLPLAWRALRRGAQNWLRPAPVAGSAVEQSTVVGR
jgi:hypothetical protein